jgi:hypothetical protein
MDCDNQPAMPDHAIPLVRKRHIRVGDEPSIGRHLFHEGIGHGAIVVVRVDKRDNDR